MTQPAAVAAEVDAFFAGRSPSGRAIVRRSYSPRNPQRRWSLAAASGPDREDEVNPDS